MPADYLCALPVHQDGSCNGLQHYAALGRDAGDADDAREASLLHRCWRRVHADAWLVGERELSGAEEA